MSAEIIRVNHNTWRIEDGGVRFFLLAGTEKALLVDSGMMVNDARDIAEKLTDLPVSLLNTHADRIILGAMGSLKLFTCTLRKKVYIKAPERAAPSFRLRKGM